MARAQFDPTIVEEFADRLYRKADALTKGMVVLGALVGAAFGAVPLTPLGDAWPIPSAFGFATLLAGASCGALIGYVIGDTRAFGYRFQAQMALRQLQVERETRAALDAVRGLRATAATHPVAPAPAPPAPVATPAPAAEPAPASAPARSPNPFLKPAEPAPVQQLPRLPERAEAGFEPPPVSPPRLYGNRSS